MGKEICISSTPHETRLAILEDDQLAEIYYERENEYTLAGSVYNGRVTRVLPGMQSAFVDLGLERDAFLYVTDFIELEDQEETDELERAAATAAPPREVRRREAPEHGKEERVKEERGGRGAAREAKPPREAAVEQVEAAPAKQESGKESEQDEGRAEGGRRWRGRRHRRGRGSTQDQRIEPEEQAASLPESEEQFEPVEKAYEPVEAETPLRAPEQAAPASSSRFVLPGESLSKYGGTPALDAGKPRTAAPARSVATSKPSTLIERPLEWDPESGLLPGESLSRRRQPAEPEPDAQEHPVLGLPDASEVEESLESEEELPPSLREMAFPHASPAPVAIEPLSEEEPAVEEELTETETAEVASGSESLPAEGQAYGESAEAESDASASHRIDPATPSTFRLFGLGGKKKHDSEAEAQQANQDASGAPQAAPAAPRSSYTPGVGKIEEEVIEGEEYEIPSHRRRAEESHDLDDYEEQTLPSQARSGDLGEMLQEAHLDHRIQVKLGQTDAEAEDEAFDVMDEEEEEEAGEQAAPGQPRRERQERDRERGRRGRGAQGQRRGPSRRSMQTTDLPVISDLLKPGQEILVQIAKEPIAKKGARITSHIALPGRFLVFMPTVNHVGVSRKIASDEERHRLKRILLHERGEVSGGFIVRTAAEGASEDELRADLRFLMNLWSEIKQRSESSKSPALIYHDLSLIERILRDQVSDNFSNIWVDSEADYERIVRFLNRFSPSLVRRVKLYTKETPLFEHFGIQDEISKALRSKVWLKSGGSIVINQTEALVAIDINTGKYVGKSARLEDTILKTNLDAVPEIVRQIRLRDLGGIIVIDFIDMDERKNRFKVMAALEEALKSDRAPTKVLQFNDFGLVAITRKRVKQSLERTLSVPCYTCQATGMVKSPTTVCNEIWIEMRKMRKHFEGQDVMLRVHPETVKVLKANNARWLNDFEELLGRNVLLKSDPALHPEQFDIQG